MAKKIVVAVMVVDTDKPNEKSEYYENVSLDIENSTAALRQVQQWVSEQMVCAKMQILTK